MWQEKSRNKLICLVPWQHFKSSKPLHIIMRFQFLSHHIFYNAKLQNCKVCIKFILNFIWYLFQMTSLGNKNNTLYFLISYSIIHFYKLVHSSIFNGRKSWRTRTWKWAIRCYIWSRSSWHTWYWSRKATTADLKKINNLWLSTNTIQ